MAVISALQTSMTPSTMIAMQMVSPLQNPIPSEKKTTQNKEKEKEESHAYHTMKVIDCIKVLGSKKFK